MPVISAEIMKTINERELQKKKKKNRRKTNKGARGTEVIVKV